MFDPVRQELFAASRGAGASLDNRRIRVGARNGLRGRDHRDRSAAHRSGRPRWLSSPESRALCLEHANPAAFGSAALDLAYVAAGRLDGFWEWGLSPWDIAAGILLVREAGGIVTGRGGADDAMTPET